MRSRLLLLALLATVTAAAIAQPAAAVRSAKYTATFTGTMHSTWDLPKYQTAQDCYRTTWFQAGGEETWNVRSQGVNKVLVTDNGSGYPQFHYGGYEYTDDPQDYDILAKGEVTRTRHQSTTFTNGTCNTLQLPMMDPPEPMDCGTRLVQYQVQLSAKGREITPDVLTYGNPIREKLGFDRCGLITPSNVLAGSWPGVSGKLTYKKRPVKGYFGTEPQIVVKGKWKSDGSQPVQGGAGTITAHVTLDWTLTFTRVGAAPVKKPKAGGRRR